MKKIEEREAQVYTFEIWPKSNKEIIWKNAETLVAILTP